MKTILWVLESNSQHPLGNLRGATPADLLADPRVAALVEALRALRGDHTLDEECEACPTTWRQPAGVPRG